MGIKFENCSAIRNGGDGFSFEGPMDAELINCISIHNGGVGFNVDGTAKLVTDMKAAVAAGETKEGLSSASLNQRKTLVLSWGR